MVGVEILAAKEVVVAYAWDWQVYCITITIASVVLAIIAFFTLYRDLMSILIGLVTGLVVGAVIGTLPASLATPSEYETQYKVTISDEVLMNEFIAKYEIISQEGKIYTVREINDE